MMHVLAPKLYRTIPGKQCPAEFQHVPQVRTLSWKHSSEEQKQLEHAYTFMHCPSRNWSHSPRGAQAQQHTALEMHAFIATESCGNMQAHIEY